ncbi:MAG: rod shape-determining protein MreC [bacterium]
MFASLVLYLLPHNTKIKLTSPLATVILSPLRGIATLRSTIATTSNANDRLAHLAAELALENARLKNHLYSSESSIAIPSNSIRLIRARVIARDITTLRRFFTVNRGSKDAVRVGTSVIAPEGIVGRVVAVSEHQALIGTIFEPDFRVAIINSRSREMGLARPIQEKIFIDYANKNADFKAGDTIVTSGLGGVFPQGLNIGVITEIFDQPDALFKSIVVKPFVNITRIEHVFLLITPDSLRDEWLDNLQPPEIKIPE